MSQEPESGGRKINLPNISGQQLRQWLLIGVAIVAIIAIGIAMSADNSTDNDATERQTVVQEHQLSAPNGDNQDSGQTVAPDHNGAPDAAGGLQDVGNPGNDPIDFE
jgi:hypothetical protein